MTAPEGRGFVSIAELPPRDELLGMRLHDITHGFEADGLRQRFIYEVEERCYDAGTTQRIHDAVAVALDVHDGQTRGDWTYATHFLRVATRIISPQHFDISDPDIIIAALLHDTVEDRPERLLAGSSAPPSSDLHIGAQIDLRHGALAAIHQGFGQEVAELIAAVTNPLYDHTGVSELEQLERYQSHVIDSAGASPKARIIKLSDLIDNYCGIKYNERPTEAKDRLAAKYAPLAIEAFRHWLAPGSTTPISSKRRQTVVATLRRGAERHMDDLGSRGKNYPALERALLLAA